MARGTPAIPFEKAIEFGEYQPEFLNQYPEFSTVSKHIQFQYIRQAIDNRRLQLRREFASISNQPDFSKKPPLEAARRRITEALKELVAEEETLQIEYAGL